MRNCYLMRTGSGITDRWSIRQRRSSSPVIFRNETSITRPGRSPTTSLSRGSRSTCIRRAGATRIPTCGRQCLLPSSTSSSTRASSNLASRPINISMGRSTSSQRTVHTPAPCAEVETTVPRRSACAAGRLASTSRERHTRMPASAKKDCTPTSCSIAVEARRCQSSAPQTIKFSDSRKGVLFGAM